MSHPRTLGRAWLAPAAAAGEHRQPSTTIAPAPLRPSSSPHRPDELVLVPTADETLRRLGLAVHHLSRVETAAWWAEDEHDRAEARRAIREAVRELGGGELRDHRGRVLERVD